MKLTGKKIKSMLLCMMLAMAMAITAVGCGSKTENTADNIRRRQCQIYFYRGGCRWKRDKLCG